METTKLPENQKSLIAVPQSVEVVLVEGEGRPLSLVLPPFDDISEIEGLRRLNFSLREFSQEESLHVQSAFSADLQSWISRSGRFHKSPAYINRLATLAHFAGRPTEELDFLAQAKEISDDDFYGHKYAEALVSRGRLEEAERLFSGFDLDADLGANLRLAYFCVMRNEVNKAERLVETALAIDPLDYGARLFDGGIKLVLQKYRQAVHSLRVAIRERPSSSVAHCNIAIAYVGLRENSKALTHLKKASALDPMNINALSLLADVSFELDKNEDSVPALRYYTQFEQKNAAVWSRMARASFTLGKYDEALAALKRQASISEGSAVWNNIGVCYQRQNVVDRAESCFSHAMKVAGPEVDHSYFLAARNIAQLWAVKGSFEKVASIVPAVLASDREGIVPASDQFSDLISIYVLSLYRLGSYESAEKVAHHYLGLSSVSDSLIARLVGALVSYQALRGDFSDVDVIADDAELRYKGGGARDTREIFFNNLAFAFAERGDVNSAEKYFSKIADLVHKNPYPTATCGLINIRKGRFEKGVELYEEAVKLAVVKRDKQRIKQKLHYEIGNFYLATNAARAIRWLDKVISERDGEPELARRARQAKSVVVGIRSKSS